MKKNKKSKVLVVVIVCAVIAVLAIVTILLLQRNAETRNISVKTMSAMVGDTVEIKKEYDGKVDVSDVEFYSSDEKIATVDKETGLLYAKESGEVVVTVKSKKSGSTIAKYSITITKDSEESGWIKYDQDNYTCYEGEQFNVKIQTGGVISTVKDFRSNNPNVAKIEFGTIDGAVLNCVNCYAAHVTCLKTGDVTLTATSSTGATTVSSLKVKKNTGWIKFDKTSYSCKEGQVFDVVMTTGSDIPSVIPSVKSIKSSMPEYATIEDGSSTGMVPNCANCRVAHVTCKKEGGVMIEATSSNGASTKSTVKITKAEQNKGTIQYDKTSYTCKVGEVVDAIITAGGTTNPIPTVKSFKSNNTGIASIESGTSSGAVTNCVNCIAVHITCKTAGSSTLSATSSTGATVSVPIKVEEATKGWVKYDKTSYSCKVGEVVDATITAGGSTVPAHITNYASNNANIATVEYGSTTGLVTNCSNCASVHITCKKTGSTTLTATSSTGASVSVSIKVEEADKGWIKYDQTSYSCDAGEVIDTKITAGGSSIPAHITNYASSDANIASVEYGTSTGLVTNCSNCAAVHITCKNSGTVTLTATSSTGATTASSVQVKENIGTISFDKTSYSCKVGQVIDTKITASGVLAHVQSYTSNNTSVATVEYGTSTGLVTNCSNCAAVHITCKKAGTATLTAKSSRGATVSVPVTVTK